MKEYEVIITLSFVMKAGDENEASDMAYAIIKSAGLQHAFADSEVELVEEDSE